MYKQNQVVGGSEISVGLPSRGVLSVDRADLANKRFHFGSSQKPARKESAGFSDGRNKDIVFHSVNGQFNFNKGLAEEDSFAERDESPESLDVKKESPLFKTTSAFVKPTLKLSLDELPMRPQDDKKPALTIHDPEVGEFTLANSPDASKKAKDSKLLSLGTSGTITTKVRPLKLSLQAANREDEEQPVRDPPLNGVGSGFPRMELQLPKRPDPLDKDPDSEEFHEPFSEQGQREKEVVVAKDHRSQPTQGNHQNSPGILDPMGIKASGL